MGEVKKRALGIKPYMCMLRMTCVMVIVNVFLYGLLTRV